MPRGFRIVAGLALLFGVCGVGLVLGVGTVLMMAFASDSGMRRETGEVIGLGVVIAGVVIGTVGGLPVVVAVFQGKKSPTMVRWTAWTVGFGALLYVGGLVTYSFGVAG
ncbi:MAG: hypothetical protein ACJAYU_000672 [Bradymonadia bacterium]|jgi:hypothetical protein